MTLVVRVLAGSTVVIASILNYGLDVAMYNARVVRGIIGYHVASSKKRRRWGYNSKNAATGC